MNSRILFISATATLAILVLVGVGIYWATQAGGEGKDPDQPEVSNASWRPDVAPLDYQAGIKLDTSELSHLALFHGGRPLPMDTFAKLALDQISERSTGTITFRMLKEPLAGKDAGRLYPEDDSEWTEQQAAALGDKLETRKFKGPLLVLSWMTDPEAWENVAFISAPHQDLREELKLPLKDPFGNKLKYVSPRTIAESVELTRYIKDFEARRRQDGEDFELNEMDKLVQELRGRYGLYRSITFDPRKPLSIAPVPLPGDRSKFLTQANQLLSLADRETLTRIEIFQREKIEKYPDLQKAAEDTLRAMAFAAQLHDNLIQQRDAYFAGAAEPGEVVGDLQVETAEQLTIDLHTSLTRLEEGFQKQKDEVFQLEGDASKESLKKVFRDLRYRTNEMKRLAFEMQLSLYDNGDGVMVVPALNAAALAKHRDTQNKSHPWLSLPAVLYGDDLMKPYPDKKVAAARAAWKQMAASLKNGKANNADWVNQQSKVLRAFRELGDSIEKSRTDLVQDELPVTERDDALIAYTKYPTAGLMATEVTYNRLTPFWWSMMLCFIAAAFFAGSVSRIRWPMISVAGFFLLLAIAWTIYGFYLRVMITGWAPVTNMYETVVFVPLVALVMGGWLMVLPLIWPAIRDGWRLSAMPFLAATEEKPEPAADAWDWVVNSMLKWFQYRPGFFAEATPLKPSQLSVLPESGWLAGGILSIFLRLAMAIGLVYFLSFARYADGDNPIFSLTPQSTDYNALIVFFVAMLCLVGSLAVLPRALIMLVSFFYFLPSHIMKGNIGWKEVSQIPERKVFVLAATLTAGCLFCLASFAPVLNENFSPLTPVLRSNFWLTIHVLTIVASYGAGLLAWGLGLIALGYYAFGQYRSPVVPKSSAKLMPDAVNQPQSLRRTPPKDVSVLANYAYRAIQVAVLLLAAGTILGGLWADVSWGRFWGWDPKEVWALISLLIYLAVLHGRYAGWFNNFGLTFGTIAGATMITMSWYGVNFALPQLAGGSVGLHSYGEGAGGLSYVAGFVLLNWIFLGIATTRYMMETNIKEAPEEVVEPIAAKLAEKVEA